MSERIENKPVLNITPRRQFQFDELDATLLALQSSNLPDADRLALEQRVNALKIIISVQGSDGCEFVYE